MLPEAAVLPADVHRCAGREDAGTDIGVSPECRACLRRTDRTTFPLQWWVSPPAASTSPCRLRLPAEGSV